MENCGRMVLQAAVMAQWCCVGLLLAQELGIAVRTVSTHLHHIYEKLHVRSATEAAARFLE